MSPDELRAMRLEKRWTLRDVATALGVTTATLSRWERGLAEPSTHALEKWKRLLTGRTDATPAARKPTRRPRGLLPRLAEFFLADIRAGLSEREAGWRELAELGLAREDILSLGQEVETDLFRVRVSPGASLKAVQQAKDILGYQRTVDVEQRRLASATKAVLVPLLQATQSSTGRSPVLLAGLAEMIRASASFVDSSRNLLENDPASLLDAPAGAAQVVLRAVDLEARSDADQVFAGMGFKSLASSLEADSAFECSQALAVELGMDVISERLGRDVIIALGAAWAMARSLDTAGVSVMTEVGVRRLAEIFWDGIGLPRPEIDAKWRRAMLEKSETETDKQQIGLLLWSWPEVM